MNLSLLNLRLGWATNSSSTHSVLFLKDCSSETEFFKALNTQLKSSQYSELMKTYRNCYIVNFAEFSGIYDSAIVELYINCVLFQIIFAKIRKSYEEAFNFNNEEESSETENLIIPDKKLVCLDLPVEIFNSLFPDRKISEKEKKKVWRNAQKETVTCDTYSENFNPYEIEIGARILSFCALKKIFNFDVFQYLTEINDEFAEKDSLCPMNPFNLETSVDSLNHWMFFDDLICFDSKAYFSEKILRFKNEKLLLSIWTDLIEKVRKEKSFLVTNFEEKISANFPNENESDANKKFTEKFLKNETFSLNCLLSQSPFFCSNEFFSNIRAKKENNVYTIFNKDLGVKFKFSFEPNFFGDVSTISTISQSFAYDTNLFHAKDFLFENNIKVSRELNDTFFAKKAFFPELVDLKISNYCPFGCSFCYQSSTREGKHADINRLKKIVDLLSECGVFEIALGGGEPSLYPDLIELIDYINEKGMSVSLTTFNYKIFNNKKLYERFLENKISSIGFSVHKAEDVHKLKKLKTKFEKDFCEMHEKKNSMSYLMISFVRRLKIIGQVVVGAVSSKDFKEIVDASIDTDTHILFLGFKNKGFGSSWNSEEVLKRIKTSLAYINFAFLTEKREVDPYLYKFLSNIKFFSIDSKFIELAEQFNQFFSMHKIPSFLWLPNEGKFSMYIDGVENKMGKSSYCDDSEMIPLTLDKKEFMEKWLEF